MPHFTLPPSSPGQRFRTARGWRIFIYSVGPILALSGGALPFLLFDKDPDAPFYTLALFALLGAGMVAFIGYAILETRRWQLTISPTVLSVRSVGRYRELPREAVAGFTVDNHHTMVHPARAGLPRLKIHETTEHYAAIQRWLAARYPDLNAVALTQHQQTVLADVRHGWRPEQREESLEQARRTARWLNGLGWLVTLWLLAYPTPYQVCVVVAVSLPAVGIMAIWLHPGTLRIDEVANNAYPSLLPLFLMPSLLLALRALLDYDILEYDSLWQVVVPCAALLLMLLAMVNREFMAGGRARWPSWLLLLFMALPYSYGSVVLLNCSFDTSATVVHPAAVVRKYTSGDFPTSYQLQLSPWPQRPTANTEATISKRVYQQILPGDSVSVAAHAGYLGIPWFSVGRR